MKKCIIIGLIAVLCAYWTACTFCTRNSERINEFVVKVDEHHNPMTFYSSYGATPNDGVVIVNSTIPNMEFNIPAASGRIRTVSDKKKNRYVLIIQPNDGNYKQYTITINAKGFKQGQINSVVVKAGLCSSYNVNPKYKIIMPTDNTVDGHEFVDLGLPSGTLWATCNVHAYKPEEPGECYAWGETWQKDKYDNSSYQYIDGYGYDEDWGLTKYCSNKECGYRRFVRHYVDRRDNLEECDDAATTKWGKCWRTPTRGEWDELIEQCKRTWTSDGVKLTGPSGDSIFLPYTCLFQNGKLRAVYWSSSLQKKEPFYAWSAVVKCELDSINCNQINVVPRPRVTAGCVRPVCSSQK